MKIESNVREVEMVEFTSIPTLISAFSCGFGTPFDDGFDFEEVPKDMVNHDKCFLLHIVGDSMQPTLFAGDRCLVDVTQIPVNNSLIAVHYNGEFLVKRLAIRGFSRFLTSDNEKYNDIKISNDESIMVIGVVYGLLRSFLK